MAVVLSSHAVSAGFNCHQIVTGSVLSSPIAEGKRTKLKNTITHYVRWCEQVLKHKFPQCAPVIWKPVACLKSAIFFRNCGCVVVTSFLIPTWSVRFDRSHSACLPVTYSFFPSVSYMQYFNGYYAPTRQTETSKGHLTQNAMKLRNKLHSNQLLIIMCI
jgi:hypothetical protein